MLTCFAEGAWRDGEARFRPRQLNKMRRRGWPHVTQSTEGRFPRSGPFVGRERLHFRLDGSSVAAAHSFQAKTQRGHSNRHLAAEPGVFPTPPLRLSGDTAPPEPAARYRHPHVAHKRVIPGISLGPSRVLRILAEQPCSAGKIPLNRGGPYPAHRHYGPQCFCF